jgi:dTDP-glucose 4,6-dehydratase
MGEGNGVVSRLLVTGGAGFIGANFVRHWRTIRPNDLVVVLDALTYAGNRASLDILEGDPDFEFVHGDICDAELVKKLFSRHDFDAVVHFAAESHVDRSIVSSDAFVQTNVVGTHVLLETALQAWKGTDAGRRFHHISTDEVFGSLGPQDAPFSEASRYDPRSPYAASKAASDFLVRAYAHTHGLPVTISNCSNNYGPYQFPEKLIPLTILNALAGDRLPVYGDGLNVRDWLYVRDHCGAIALVLTHGRTGETYNIGGGQEMTNIDIVHLLCDEIDRRVTGDVDLAKRFPRCPAGQGGSTRELISFVKDRPGHDRRYAICADKIAQHIGYTAQTPLAEGLACTVDWYLENEEWWQSVRNGAYRDWIKLQYGAAS